MANKVVERQRKIGATTDYGTSLQCVAKEQQYHTRLRVIEQSRGSPFSTNTKVPSGKYAGFIISARNERGAKMRRPFGLRTHSISTYWLIAPPSLGSFSSFGRDTSAHTT